MSHRAGPRSREQRRGHFVEHVWFKGAWGSEFLFALLLREWQARKN